MSSETMDPYDFAASLLSQETLACVDKFWSTFAQDADELHKAFTAQDKAGLDKPLSSEPILKALSADIILEFCLEETGHEVCITAGWSDDERPLTRLIKQLAPDLPHWQVSETRKPHDAGALFPFSPENFLDRYGHPLRVEDIEASLNPDGRIDIMGFGGNEPDELIGQTLNVASMILGEDIQRDWIGYTESRPTLRKTQTADEPSAMLDAGTFARRFQEEIEKAKGVVNRSPYSKRLLEHQNGEVIHLQDMPPEHRRADLEVISIPEGLFAKGAINSPWFSSRCYSCHNEWFMYLRVPRADIVPDGLNEALSVLVVRLHQALSEDGLGGCAMHGYGRDAIYADVAVTDVALAIARIEMTLANLPFAARTTLHFMDRGLEDISIPLSICDVQRH